MYLNLDFSDTATGAYEKYCDNAISPAVTTTLSEMIVSIYDLMLYALYALYAEP